MIMECKVPIPSIPDAFDIYPSFNPHTTTHPTLTYTTSTMSTTALPSTSTTSTFTTTASTTSIHISEKCFFEQSDNGAIFDTGEPYSNNARKG